MKRSDLPPPEPIWFRCVYSVTGATIHAAGDAAVERYVVPCPSSYTELVNLVRSARRDAKGALARETEERIADWCSRFGVLGLALHRAESVVTPVDTDAAEGDWPAMSVQRRFSFTPYGWHTSATTVDAGSPSRVHHDLAGVVRRSLTSFERTWAPFDVAWARYFPNLQAGEHSWERLHPARYDTFFREYQEPVEEFLEAAVVLSDAISDLAGEAGQTDASATVRAEAVAHLNALALPAIRHIWLAPDGSFAERWTSPSLLALLAAAALHDLLNGQRVHVCQNRTCNRLFVSGAYQAAYCSTRCRHTVNKRMYRTNHAVRASKETQ